MEASFSSSSTPSLHTSPSTETCQLPMVRITGQLQTLGFMDIADPLGDPFLCDPFLLGWGWLHNFWLRYNWPLEHEVWELHNSCHSSSKAGLSSAASCEKAAILEVSSMELVQKNKLEHLASDKCVYEGQIQDSAYGEKLADSVKLPGAHISLKLDATQLHPALRVLVMRQASSLLVTDAAFLETWRWIPSSSLRHLFIRDPVKFPASYESILNIPSLEGLFILIGEKHKERHTDLQYMERLCHKLTTLGLDLSDCHDGKAELSVLECLVEVLHKQTTRVKHLRLDLEVVDSDEAAALTQLLPRFAAECNLTRLVLSFLKDSPQDFDRFYKPILEAVFTSSSLLDLRIRFSLPDTINAVAELMGVIRDTRIVEKLQVLRLSFSYYDEWGIKPTASKEAALNNGLRILAEGLTKPSCTVRFLDLFSDLHIGRECEYIFQWLLKHTRSDIAFRALRIGTQNSKDLLRNGCLAEYLRSPACSLVWLECFAYEKPEPEDRDWKGVEIQEWELANSLTDNFSICYLSFPWTHLGPKAHAAFFVRRNVLCKSGQLMKEPHVKPNVVKLFICGHSGAGKTTLCRALLSKFRTEAAEVVPSFARFLPTFKASHRTRGMELHPLRFSDTKKLIVCDLGGQEEFHVLHHFFMHASDNDLFIVVCESHEGLSQEAFEKRLNYWLRFIISHRSKVKLSTDESGSLAVKRPKVIVVVNFFTSPAPQSTPETMNQIAHEKTQSVLPKFLEALNFGDTDGGSSTSPPPGNVFGINVIAVGQAIPVKKRLEALLKDFLGTALPIPKLCNDIATQILPPDRRWVPPQQDADGLFMTYSEVLERCSVVFSDGCNHVDNEHRIKTALMVLHNQGRLVFFPKNEDITKKEPGDTLVIIDSGWFCNTLIGALLGTHLQEGPRLGKNQWVWKKEDIKSLLRKQGICKGEHLEEVLRYLQELELCIPLVHGRKQEKASCNLRLLFPALLRKVNVHFPEVGEGAIFFGRRLKCKNSSIHLVPFGVYTRLQVRLHKLYDNESFELGYGWTSFVKDNVGVVVRFGGENEAMHSTCESKQWIDSSCESKQWIDILVFCPNVARYSSGVTVFASRPHSSMRLGNELMDTVKAVIDEIFQAAGFGGLPTVKLQEWVLRNHTFDSPDQVKLSSVLKKVKTKGLEASYQEWRQSTSTPVLELLLPKELDTVMERQCNSLKEIKEEYSFGVNGTEGGDQSAKSKGIKEPVELEDGGEAGELTGQIRELWRLTRGEMKRGFAEVNATLQDVRAEIQSLNRMLGQAVKDIIAECSTSLLRLELEEGASHPLYPFLVDPEKRKLKPLKELFRKQARLHFMCESRTEGPHLVEGQKGVLVTVEVKEWLAKVAKMMVPAFIVMCCLARIAATVYLPAAHVFIPTPDFLVELGIDKEGLQQVILPQALKALLDQVDGVDYRSFLTKEGSELQSNEVKDAIQSILKNKEIDMAADFALQRVADSDDRTLWVCKQHVGTRRCLKPIPNPFQ